jgi:catechol 2,3-dioxygenase-like lactoylglutathione lyase family enzyme
MRFVSMLNLVAAIAMLSSTAMLGEQSGSTPPHIIGIAHVDYFVSEMPKALKFWHDFLGFDESHQLIKLGAERGSLADIKINDHQYIELHNETPTSPPGMMSGLYFSVNDVEAMRKYLQSKGYAAPSVRKTRNGDLGFEIKDPDGTLVGFEQARPDGLEARDAGRFLPPTRVSMAIFHAGFIVGNTEKSVAFYRDVLGFRETWRGSSDGKELSWINMQVPGDADYIELMLYDKVPGNYGSSNHTSLVVPDMQEAIATLRDRAATAGYTKPLEIREGKNHKRQVNLYDPDGTRVELMEPQTVDGKPAPSSTAPPPPAAHE